MPGAPGAWSLPFRMEALRWNLYRKFREENQYRPLTRYGRCLALAAAQLLCGVTSLMLHRRWLVGANLFSAFVLGATVSYTAALLWVNRREPAIIPPNGQFRPGDFPALVLLVIGWAVGLINLV